MRPGGTLSRQAGFGLVEMVLVMIIIGVVSAIAFPSFQAVRTNADVRSVASDLVSALTMARTQAVTLRVDVQLAPQDGGWANGWEMTFDWPAGAPAIEDDMAIFKSGSVSIAGPASPVTFLSSGIVSNGAVSFDLCRSGWGREVRVTPLGRITVEEVSC